MNSILPLPVVPMEEWVTDLTHWITRNFSQAFSAIQSGGSSLINGINDILLLVPPAVFIIVLAVILYFLTDRKWEMPIFALVGLGFILNQGLWTELMSTVSLVLVSSIVSVVLGIPLGILAAKSEIADTIINPILDFMQTMPAFVYLIPAVAFFGIGVVPGAFASIIFALPPTVKFTNLGLRQIPKELVEAADAFGSTARQKLVKVELPIAQPTILAGVNQTVKLALSMVVTGSMIGAPGLGSIVLTSLQRAQIGPGFVAGISIVFLAIIFDRMTSSITSQGGSSE